MLLLFLITRLFSKFKYFYCIIYGLLYRIVYENFVANPRSATCRVTRCIWIRPQTRPIHRNSDRLFSSKQQTITVLPRARLHNDSTATASRSKEKNNHWERQAVHDYLRKPAWPRESTSTHSGAAPNPICQFEHWSLSLSSPFTSHDVAGFCISNEKGEPTGAGVIWGFMLLWQRLLPVTAKRTTHCTPSEASVINFLKPWNYF
jgi:hypothetical protein